MLPLSARSHACASFFAILALIAVLVFGLRTAAAQTNTYAHRPGEVLVQWAPGTSAAEIEAIRRDLGATRMGTFRQLGLSHERITRFTVEQAIARYDRDPRIRYIEPNYILHMDAAPNDSMFGQLWGLHNIGQTGGTPGADIHATQAWDLFTGSSSVLVAIIDTGMDYTHPDLAANAFVNPGEIAGNGLDDDGNGFIDDVHGWDFANDDNDPYDDVGHGTHCAGTIGAVGNNALGVVGVNWNVKLLPIKFLGADGSGTTADAVSSIEYATLMHVRVMSNSWGGGPYSEALRGAIAAAGDAGIVFVASAGNSSDNNDTSPSYPASYDLPNIIAVAASDPNDQLAGFSNFGPTSVDLAAPGTDILSTVPGGYQYKSGTSMAAPHVSGAAALVLGRFPGLDGAGAKALLLADVDPVPALAGLTLTGGRLNALLPLTEPDSIPPAPITDLAVTRMEGSWAELQWTATGDDGATGKAARYDVRFSTAPITAANFAAAARATGVPDPQPAGSIEHVRIDGLGLFSTTYYFAVQAHDELGNPSGMSNVASGTTLGPPQVQVAPASLSADLLTGEQATRTLMVSNTGVSELSFHLGSESFPVPPVAVLATVAASPAPLAAATAAGPAGSYAAGAAPSRGLILPAGTSPTGATTAGGLRVLLLQCGGAVGEIQGLLSAFPDIDSVDVVDGGITTPTLEQLRAYASVIVIVSSSVGDRVALGNVLADYIDDGGGVVFTLASFITDYALQGRLLTGGYYPFDLGSGPAGSSVLGAFDTAHPIMQGVGSCTGDVLGLVTVPPGSELVASWANGFPFVATRGPHVAGVNIYLGSPGYWTGDVPLILHNAAFWVRGTGRYLSWSPAAGVVPPGGSADVQVTYDATGLVGGNYDAYVAVMSNDPVTPKALVPSHLHVTGAPDILLSASSLDFGSLFIGAAKPETVTVTNRGTDLLTVTSVAVSPADFTAPAGGFDLAPGASRPLIVTFAPQSAALLTGALVVHSNDPDSPEVTIALHGEGLVAPEIAVSPTSLSAGLFVGEKATRTLTITNSGGSPLEVSLSTSTPPAPAPGSTRTGWASGTPAVLDDPPVSGRPSPGPTANTTAAPLGPVAMAGDYTGTYLHFGITDFGEIMPFQYPNGNEHLNVGSPLSGYTVAYQTGSGDHVVWSGYNDRQGLAPVSYREITNTAALLVAEAVTQTTDSLLRVTRTFTFDKHDKGVAIRTTLQNLTGTMLTNVVFKDWADWDVDNDYADDSWDYDRTRNMTYGWDVHYAGIASFDAPTAMDFYGWDDYANRSTTVEYTTGPVTNFDGLALLHFDLGDLSALASHEVATAFGIGDDLAELQAVMDRTATSASWLSMDPRSLVVPAHSSQPVTVTFDAGRLVGGDYDASVALRSNDPVRPELLVPAHLHVTGAPDIAVSSTDLDFDSLYVGASRAESLLVSNSGTDLLTVTSVAASPGDFTVPLGGFTLAPGAARTLAVTFSPLSAATIVGTLEIHSDDPDESILTVSLHGTGVIAPAIVVTPDSLTAELFTGDRLTQPLVVANPGGSPLTWSLTISSASLPAAPALAARGLARPSGVDAVSVASAGRQDGAGLPRPSGPSGLAGLLRNELAALGTTQTVFYDDMEHGDNGWTQQVYGIDDLWHRTTRAYNSPSTSWWCGRESTGDYATGNPIRTAAVTPPIDLSRAIAPVTLQFFEFFSTEPGYDNCMVDVSSASDSGTTWTSLRGGLGFAPSGNSGGWRLAMLDLSPWTGQTIRIRFYFDTIDGIANSFPGWFFDDVLVSATSPPWLSVTPTAGSVAAAGSQSLQAVFDAAGLPGGDYLASIDFASNDPLTPLLAVPARLHVTGAPNISVSAERLDFGTVFVGGSRTDSLVVTNVGTDLLDVSAVDIAPGVFHGSSAGFTLAAGDSRTLAVTYAPTVVGTSGGMLTLHSNDQDQSTLVVALAGTCVLAPHVVLSPQIFQRLMPPDAVATEALTLNNTGGSPLTWNITASLGAVGGIVEPLTEVLAPAPDAAAGESLTPAAQASRVVQSVPATLARAAGDGAPAGAGAALRAPPVSAAGARFASQRAESSSVAPPPLADALAQLNTRYPSVTSIIPNRFDFSEGETGNSIVDGGQDMYDIGNLIRTNLGGPITYSNNAISYSSAFGASYFTRKYPGLFVLAADLVGVNKFTIYGKLGASGAGEVDGAVLSVSMGGLNYLGYVKRVFNAGDASVNHLIILVDPGSTSRSFYNDTNNDFDEVSTTAPLARLYYVLMAGNAGAYISDASMFEIMKAFINALTPAPPWLSVTPASGVVPAHGNSSVSVRFDTHGLALGTQLGSLAVNSDDPIQPLVTVPVELDVEIVTATDVALVSSSADPGVAHLLWHASQSDGHPVAVQRRGGSGEWAAVASIVPDGEGYLRFEDHDVLPAARYGYRLGITAEGTLRFVGETWLDIPAGVELALHGLLPNPAVRDLRVAFSLADAQPATLELLDLAGRRLRARAVGTLGAGRHSISLGTTATLPPGMYLVRLQCGERSLIVKGVVLE